MAVQFVLLCLHAEYHRILEHGAFAIRLLVDMGLFALYIQCGTLRQDDHFAICSKRVTNSATGPIDIPNTALPRSVVEAIKAKRQHRLGRILSIISNLVSEIT